MVEYIVKPTANRRYVREILSRLPKGYRIGHVFEPGPGNAPARKVNGSHPVVVCPDGTLLRSRDGRVVTVAGTPGTQGSLRADIARALTAIKEAQ